MQQIFSARLKFLNVFYRSTFLLLLNPLQQRPRRLIVWILWDEFALYGQLEDGLAQVGDGAGVGIEEVEVIAEDLGGVLEGGGVGGVVEVVEHGAVDDDDGLLGAAQFGFQGAALGEEFVHFGDDALLLGQWWEGDDKML